MKPNGVPITHNATLSLTFTLQRLASKTILFTTLELSRRLELMRKREMRSRFATSTTWEKGCLLFSQRCGCGAGSKTGFGFHSMPRKERNPAQNVTAGRARP